MIDQWVDGSAGTFWSQKRSVPIATSGTVATINDTAPTGDRWNLASAEILASSSASAQVAAASTTSIADLKFIAASTSVTSSGTSGAASTGPGANTLYCPLGTKPQER
jgi:hypothetical protein